MIELSTEQTEHDRLAFAVHYVSEGTWVYRCDVQDTVSADEYRSPAVVSQTRLTRARRRGARRSPH